MISKADLLIWAERTPQEDAKSNNAAQYDKQHNAALRRRNKINKKTQEKNLIWTNIMNSL
jgi:hypothetical protein